MFKPVAKRHARNSDIDLNALRTFVAIAEAGSFVGGGTARRLSRSAAGKAMSRLEAHLGTRLFHRTTRRVSMTTDGQAFYDRCVQILEDLQDAETSLRQNHSRPTGTLRLSVSEAYGRLVILPFLKDVVKDWPQLNIEINFTDRMVDLVEEGFDLGIRVGSASRDTQLITRVIDRTRPCIYAAPSYLAASGTPTDVHDLAGHQRLVYGLGSSADSWMLFDATGTAFTVNGHSRIRFDSGEAIRAAAIEGIGIAYLPSFLVQTEIRENRLVQLFPDLHGDEIAIHAAYPNRKHLASRVRMFIDRLTDRLRS
jgi:DNA-binding transcriptional LysR family regulator